MTGAGSSPVVDIGSFRGRDIIVQFGLTATPASFQARIKRFLRSYLGTESAPVPFGGRAAELKRLNDWLLSDDSQRNLLVTAPAGRGKTSLLIHWIHQLDGLWPIAFVPISIRYETNRAAVFYQALAARLASILNETLPATPSDPANFYKEKVIEYFDSFESSDRRCLVVVDGIDEATGWQIDPSVFPSEPPRGLKILVSARQVAGDYGAQDWLRRLGWTTPSSQGSTIEVPPLTHAGIGDVLEKMGFPLGQLAQDVDIIGELFRLTEGGDPLLLKLYVADLWKRGDAASRLRPQDLASLKPGFGPYFRDWFEQQQKAWQDSGLTFDKDKLDALMALLSCAMGPITLAAISQIVQHILDPNCIVTRETIAPIRRFVLGDGVETGLVFGHPKLAEFIQNDYFAGSRIVEQARRAFVIWGRAIIHDLELGNMRPNQVPGYCLLYYVQHLEGQPGVSTHHYRELVENGWRSAWLSHEEGLRGFARDIEVVWEKLLTAAEADHKLLKQPHTGLGGLIRCALCLTSIRSIGAAVSPNFMAELVRQHLIGPKQALHFTRLKEEGKRSETLQALAPHLTGEMDDAISCAREIQAPKNQALALAALAQYVGEPDRSRLISEAINAAGRCKESYDRDS